MTHYSNIIDRLIKNAYVRIKLISQLELNTARARKIAIGSAVLLVLYSLFRERTLADVFVAFGITIGLAAILALLTGRPTFAAIMLTMFVGIVLVASKIKMHFLQMTK